VKTRILPPTTENIRLAAQALIQGDVVGMPTETVYGLAGSAFNETALAKIFSTKERPTFDPLILHVPLLEKNTSILEQLRAFNLIDLEILSSLAKERAEKLLKTFWPGPFTLVLPKNPRVPDLATSGLPNVALRMPKHPVAQKLILEAGTPLAAPSANRFGRISPTSAQDVSEELGGRIEWILDGGQCEVGLESTVVSLDPSGLVSLLRPGGTPAAEIEKLLDISFSPKTESQPMISPGMLESHYAPEKKLQLLPARLTELTQEQRKNLQSQAHLWPEKLGLMILHGNASEAQKEFEQITGKSVQAQSLSPTGDWEEAARTLFSLLRSFDSSSEVRMIFAEPCTEQTGLAHAIGDRLKRASAKSR